MFWLRVLVLSALSTYLIMPSVAQTANSPVTAEQLQSELQWMWDLSALDELKQEFTVEGCSVTLKTTPVAELRLWVFYKFWLPDLDTSPDRLIKTPDLPLSDQSVGKPDGYSFVYLPATFLSAEKNMMTFLKDKYGPDGVEMGQGAKQILEPDEVRQVIRELDAGDRGQFLMRNYSYIMDDDSFDLDMPWEEKIFHLTDIALGFSFSIDSQDQLGRLNDLVSMMHRYNQQHCVNLQSIN